MGFEEASTEALLTIQGNLLNGLDIVAERIKDGTFEAPAKEGSAPPSQAGWLTFTLLLEIEDELESRILGFKRTIDPKSIVV